MDDEDFDDLSQLIGKKVIRRNINPLDKDDGTSEVGVIVYAWRDFELNAVDCYVAFLGEDWPKLGEKPEHKPNILRYLLSSLEEIS